MSDRQRRYLERQKAGKRVYRVELIDADAEELVAGFGHGTADMDAGVTRVLELLLDLDHLLTRHRMRLATVLISFIEELRSTDEDTL